VGKTSIGRWLVKQPGVTPSVSATSRRPRPTEVDGRDYWFITEDEFRRRIDEGFFLEWAKVFGNYYGTPRGPVEKAVADGMVCLLEIDVQGARQVMEKCPAAVTIFVTAPSFEEAARRLAGRRTETEAQRQVRLEEYNREMAASHLYQHVIVNSDLDASRREAWDIIRQARS
jgi:guanylate kinase